MGIKANETLKMDIKKANSNWTYYSKTHDFETVKEYKKYLPKKYIMPGINLEVMCVNPNCLEYGKSRVVPLGTGQFEINEIMNNTKCHLCPDRDKGTEPPMAVKRVKFVSCYWRFEGDIIGDDGFPTRRYSKGWFKVSDCNEEAFAKLMASSKWTSLKLVLKGL